MISSRDDDFWVCLQLLLLYPKPNREIYALQISDNDKAIIVQASDNKPFTQNSSSSTLFH